MITQIFPGEYKLVFLGTQLALNGRYILFLDPVVGPVQELLVPWANFVVDRTNRAVWTTTWRLVFSVSIVLHQSSVFVITGAYFLKNKF